MEQVNQLRSIESGCWNSVSMFPIKRMTHLQPQEFLNGQTAEETHRTGRLSKQDWKMLHSGRTPFSSVQFSHSVVSDSLWPQELQHARPPCPSPTPGVHPNSWAYWAPTDLGSSPFSVLSFCLFILFMGFSRQEYWSGLPFPSPVDHILSDLSTMTHLSWVAPHSMA